MDERLNKIIFTTIELFNKYGIRSVSMDDICTEMGISKKTLYQYVNNKSEIVEHMLDYLNEYIIEIFEESRSKNLNAIDTLLDFSEALGDVFRQIKTNPSIDYDLKKYYSDVYKKHCEKRDKKVILHIANNIKQGIEEGLYRKDLKIDLIANLYKNKMENIAEPDFLVDGKYSFYKIHKVMIESHIRGIANNEGIRYFESKSQK